MHARTDLWEPWAGNRPGRPSHLARIADGTDRQNAALERMERNANQ